jgi:thiol-disulfide isomerase/thioredoxin
VSCGPCKASIPFLKQLGTEYKKADFDFAAIECSSSNQAVLKNYMTRNKFDYKFLVSTKEVMKKYSVSSFPVFFILDENRVIRKVVNGYDEGTTDMEIRKSVNALMN